jgi:hypothetical protein
VNAWTYFTTIFDNHGNVLYNTSKFGICLQNCLARKAKASSNIDDKGVVGQGVPIKHWGKINSGYTSLNEICYVHCRMRLGGIMAVEPFIAMLKRCLS